MDETAIDLLCEIRDAVVEMRDDIHANMTAAKILEERRAKHREAVARGRANAKSVTSQEDVTSQETNEEGEEEISPHTPLIGEGEEDKREHANLACACACESDRGTSGGGTGKTKDKSERKKIPPTLEMVAAYCAERGNKIDPNEFVDFYTSKNWFVGKDKMTDWQAAVRTWERRPRYSDRGGSGGGGFVRRPSNYLEPSEAARKEWEDVFNHR